jgi:hypothetical protein
VLGPQEALVDGVVEEPQQEVKVAERVEETDRLRMQPELRPRGHLGQLVQRAQPSG